MTKVELEKEAEEYTKNLLKKLGIKEDMLLENQPKYLRQESMNFVALDVGNVTDAYLASAEPREKRIAELEAQNKWLEGCKSELAEHLGKANDRIAELEKEVEKHKWNDIFLEDCAVYDKKIAEEYTTLQEQIAKLKEENKELKEVHESDKRSLRLIAEKGANLEREISVLLSCKNCPDNKGGYICQKEYEDKCLAQKIQYIKELQEENAELKAKIYGGGYEAVITKKDADIILLEHLLKEQKELHKSVCNQLTHTHRNLRNQLTKAKELIKELYECLDKLYLSGLSDKQISFIEQMQDKAEQFLKEGENE